MSAHLAVEHQVSFGNHLLDDLPASEHEILLAHLKPVRLDFDQTIYYQGDRLGRVFFPVDSVVSNLVVSEDGVTTEVCMIGREALTGVASVVGGSVAYHWTRVTVGGRAWAVEAAVLKDLFLRHEAIQKNLLGAYCGLISQVSQRGVCSARHSVMQRLCCWLLMIHDRTGTDDINLTHEVIAGRLGNRRAGITNAARSLQALEGISYNRGKIHIVDREAIRHTACECYERFSDDFYGREIARGRQKFDTGLRLVPVAAGSSRSRI